MAYSISEAERERRRVAMKLRHQDPAFQERLRAARLMPEFKKYHAEGCRNAGARALVREERRQRMLRQRGEPGFQEKTQEGHRRWWSDPANNPLAALTPDQRAVYDRLRNKGCDREAALTEAGKG